jgi:hypothetical protein
VTKKEYEYQCFVRRPAFLRDCENLRQQHPLAQGYFGSSGFEAPAPPGGDPHAFQAEVAVFRQCLERHPGAMANLWGRGRGWLDEIFQTKVDQANGEPFTDAELRILRAYQEDLEAQRAFRTKYPWFNDFFSLSMVRQPFPLAFDPPWKVCVDQVVTEFMGAHAGRAPGGIVTRAGVESVGRAESPEAADVYRRARELFAAQSIESLTLLRQSYGPAIFGSARIFVPIGPETTLEQVKRLWPTVQHAQLATYGHPPRVRKRAPRANLYDERLKVYDAVAGGNMTVRRVAEHLRKPARTILRRFWEARRDIEGETALGGQWSPEQFDEHTTGCPTCRRAKTADDYCNRAQRELGRRSWWVDRRGGDLEAAEREEIRRKGRRIEPGAALGARTDEPEQGPAITK